MTSRHLLLQFCVNLTIQRFLLCKMYFRFVCSQSNRLRCWYFSISKNYLFGASCFLAVLILVWVLFFCLWLGLLILVEKIILYFRYYCCGRYILQIACFWKRSYFLEWLSLIFGYNLIHIEHENLISYSFLLYLCKGIPNLYFFFCY
jgi:hypothetical protein